MTSWLRPDAHSAAWRALVGVLAVACLAATGAHANQHPIIDRLVATPSQVGPGGFVELRLEAHDPDCPSTCDSGCGVYIRSHSWRLTGGAITRNDPSVPGSPYVATAQWQAPPTLGTYRITAAVADSGNFFCGRGRAEAYLDILVTDSPNAAPVVTSLVASPASLFDGESASLTCEASDPDGDPVTLSWTAETGTVVPGPGGTATFTAADPGAPRVDCTATDPYGASGSSFVRIAVIGAAAERQLDQGLLAPHRVTIDSQGDLLAVDASQGAIVAVHVASGEPAWRLPAGDIRSLDADWNDDLLVGGPDGARIVDRRGVLVRNLQPDDGLGDAWDVAVDSVRHRYGVLHRAAGRVQVYDESGTRIAAFGSTGDAPEQLRDPRGLAVTPGGDWVVADAGHFAVKVFSITGALLRTFGSPGTGAGRFTQMDDVDVDGDGVVFVSDPFQDWVQSFRADGTPREVIGTYGLGLGRVRTPAGLAVSGDRLFVASTNSSTVQVFRIEAVVAPLTDLPGASASPASLSFGPHAVGTASPPLTVTLANTGSAPLGLLRFSVDVPFALAHGCGPFVEPGATCELQVAFAPEAPQAALGFLRIETSAGGAPLVVALDGQGFVPADLVLDQQQGLDFEDTDVGTMSPPRRVTLTNPGTVPLDIASIAVTSEYVVSDDCGASLPGGASCHADVRFAPTAVGDHVLGTLVVHSSAPASPHSLPLDGRAVNPRIRVLDVEVVEGDGGTVDAAFVLTLSGPSPFEVSVDYATAPGTATEGEDYEATSGTFRFAPGTVAGTVTVPVVADFVLEPDVETFRLELASPVNAVIEDGIGEARILDDERCPSHDLVANGSVEARACDDAVPGWTVVSGTGWSVGARGPEAADGRLRIAAGLPTTPDPAELVQDIDVRAFSAAFASGAQRVVVGASLRTTDELPSDAARLVVEWRDADNAVVLDAYDSGDVVSPWDWTRVQDERVAPPDTGWIRVRLLATWGGEGANDAYFDAVSVSTLRVPTVAVEDSAQWEDPAWPQVLQIGVSVACPYWQAVEGVAFTEDVTAEAGLDYEPVAATWEIPPGDTRTGLAVAVLPDAVEEGHESLAFRIESVLPSDVVVVRAEATGLIRDDDACPRSVGWWKTHPDSWPVTCLELGDDLLPEGALLALLGYGGPDEGLKLGRQLTATKLNLEAGAPPTLLEPVAEADAFLREHPLGSPLSREEQLEARRLTRAVHENSCDD